MRTRKSKAATRVPLANILTALGGVRDDTFHMHFQGSLARLSTRPTVNQKDLNKDPGATTFWLEGDKLFGIQQAKFLVHCKDKKSWQDTGQYNLSPASVKGVAPTLVLL